MEEVLFSRGEDKIGPAIHALEDAVLKFRHISWPRFPLNCVAVTAAAPPIRRRLMVIRFPGAISSGFVCERAPALPAASRLV
jgi:hypothetical protein